VYQADPTSAAASELGSPRPGLPVDPHRVWRALRRGKSLLGASLLLGALGGAAAAKLLVVRTYQASAVLLWEGSTTGDDAASGKDLRSIAESVKITDNLAAVRELLDEPTTLSALGRRLEVKTTKDTNLLQIVASGEASDEATRLAQTTVDVFLARREELERQRLEEDLRRHDVNLDAAEAALETTRRSFDSFRREHGLLDLPVERQAALDLAARLRSEADLALAMADGSRARVDTFLDATRGQSAVAVLAEKELRPGQKRLAEARAELAALSGSLDASHPKLQALGAEVDALAREEGATSSVAKSERTIGRNPHWEALQEGLAEAEAARRDAETRRATYATLAKKAEEQTARLTQSEGAAARLLSSVKVGERRVAELQTLRAVAADAVRTPHSGFRLLAPPRTPDLPTKSARRIVAILGPIVALVVAAVALVLRELGRLRVATTREAAFWSGAPVLGATLACDGAAADDLAEELLCSTPASAPILVLGVDEASSRAAGELLEAVRRVSGVPPRDDQDDRIRWVTPAQPLSRAARRRAARESGRVLVVATSDTTRLFDLRDFVEPLAKVSRVGVVLADVGNDFAQLPDQVGDVESFARAATK
jgi:uncharacterized protein involved in exopolysaccharide biosynthesis